MKSLLKINGKVLGLLLVAMFFLSGTLYASDGPTKKSKKAKTTLSQAIAEQNNTPVSQPATDKKATKKKVTEKKTAKNKSEVKRKPVRRAARKVLNQPVRRKDCGCSGHRDCTCRPDRCNCEGCHPSTKSTNTKKSAPAKNKSATNGKGKSGKRRRLVQKLIVPNLVNGQC